MTTQALKPETAPVPVALYGCRRVGCDEEQAYEPDMLQWWDGSIDNPAGWYCDGCLDYVCQETRLELYDSDHAEDGNENEVIDLVESMKGPTLYAELARRRDALTVTC